MAGRLHRPDDLAAARALAVVLAVAALATFYSVWTQGTEVRLDISTETNAFALLLGVALAFALAAVRHRGWELPTTSPLVPFVVLVAVSAFPGHGLAVDHPLFRPLGAVYAVIGVWLVYAAVSGHSRVVGSRVMVFFGTISYALYLWHQTFINSLLLGEHSTPRNLLLIAAAVLVSWLSWVLVERPVGRLRTRLRLDQPSARQQAYAVSRSPATDHPSEPAPRADRDERPARVRSSGPALSGQEKERAAPLHFQRIAHGGPCGKAPVVAENHGSTWSRHPSGALT